MILAWMLYASLVAALLGLGAASLEGAVRQRGWATRWLWVAALGGALLVPLTALLQQRVGPVPAAPAAAPQGTLLTPSIAVRPYEWLDQTDLGASSSSRRPAIALWILGAWGAASLLLAIAVLLSYRALLRRSGTWQLREVDGRLVWVAPDTGPAVVGFRPGRIVLPEWVLERDGREREMILAHEEEHLERGDPRLLLGSLALLVVLPWNLTLWWIWRRLRQALEVDCDRRVLRRGADPRAYGRILLDVRERGTAHRLMVAALSESPRFLERRIRHMVSHRSKHWPLRLAWSLLLAGALVVTACRVDRPERTPIPRSARTLQSSAPAGSPERWREVDAAMRAAVARYHPELLARRVEGGTAYVWFLTNSRGEVEATVLETEPVGVVGTTVEQLERLFPTVANWRRDWRTGLTTGAGSRSFQPGELGPNRVAFIWWERKVEGEPTGPYFFQLGGFTGESVLRAAVERHHLDVLRDGSEPGELLWFVLDEWGEVLHTGRGMRVASSEEARRALEAAIPGLRIGPMQMSSAVTSADGRRMPIVWATLETIVPHPVAAEPLATILIRPGSLYYLNGENRPLSLDALTSRLRSVAAGAAAPRTIRVLAEPGVVGYDVVMAMNAAAVAGFEHATGIAEYVPGEGNAKVWEQPLERPTEGPSLDTLPARRSRR